jgi:hypothetical protein
VHPANALAAVLASALLAPGCVAGTVPVRVLLDKPAAEASSGAPRPGAVYDGDVVRAADRPVTWRARAVGGAATLAGSGTGSGASAYAGVDLERRVSGDLAQAAAWRTHEGTLVGGAPDPTAGPSTGPSPPAEGRFHHVAGLLALERVRPPGSRRIGVRAAAGPEVFWTDGFAAEDGGFGAMAEAALTLPVGRRARAVLAGTVHGLSTDAAGGGERWIWVFAGTLGLEVDL